MTADFTPDPALMLATCAFIAGVVETVLRWEDFGLRQLDRYGIPSHDAVSSAKTFFAARLAGHG